MLDRVKGLGLGSLGEGGPTLHPVETVGLGTSSLVVVVGAGAREQLTNSNAAVYSDVCVTYVLLLKRECEVVSLMMPRILWLSSSNSSKLPSFSCHRPNTHKQSISLVPSPPTRPCSTNCRQ